MIIDPIGDLLTRIRNGLVVDKFYVFLLSGYHGASIGRIANVSVR